MTNEAPEARTLSLIRGDALFRLQRKIGLIPGDGLGLVRRAVFYALLTWLPIAIWAWLRGHAFTGGLDEPLLQHYGVHVRCLVAIPLLIIAEGGAHAVSMRLLPQFVRAGIVADNESLQSLVQDIARLRDRTLPWVLIVGLVLAFWFVNFLYRKHIFIRF